MKFPYQEDRCIELFNGKLRKGLLSRNIQHFSIKNTGFHPLIFALIRANLHLLDRSLGHIS